MGLNDAIEAGLVKTPRVVVRDDAPANAKIYQSKLYHLYNEPEVKEDLGRKAVAHEPLPDLVQKAYALLAYDWNKTAEAWQTNGHEIPPVMLTVCNRTETAARIERFFNDGDCLIQDLDSGGEPWPPSPQKPSIQVEVVPARNQFEIRWPNVLRVESVLKPQLAVQWEEVTPFPLDPK